jgi:hypothetical protein
VRKNWKPSRFGVKFWMGSSVLLSILYILDAAILFAHADRQLVDWWLGGVNRFLAILITWGASFVNYRRIRFAAVKSGASEDLLLMIQYSCAMTLSFMCVVVIILLIAQQ